MAASEYLRPFKTTGYTAPVSLDLVDKQLAYSQARFDKNLDAINQFSDNLESMLDVPESDVQYVQAKVNDMYKKAEQLSGKQLASGEARALLSKEATSLLVDNRISSALRGQAMFKKVLSDYDTLAQKNPKLYSSDNRDYAYHKYNNWVNQRNNGQYIDYNGKTSATPYINEAEYFKKYFKDMHGFEYSESTPDGKGRFIDRSGKIVDPNVIKSATISMIEGDANLRAQAEINAWSKFRGSDDKSILDLYSSDITNQKERFETQYKNDIAAIGTAYADATVRNQKLEKAKENFKKNIGYYNLQLQDIAKEYGNINNGKGLSSREAIEFRYYKNDLAHSNAEQFAKNDIHQKFSNDFATLTGLKMQQAAAFHQDDVRLKTAALKQQLALELKGFEVQKEIAEMNNQGRIDVAEMRSIKNGGTGAKTGALKDSGIHYEVSPSQNGIIEPYTVSGEKMKAVNLEREADAQLNNLIASQLQNYKGLPDNLIHKIMSDMRLSKDSDNVASIKKVHNAFIQRMNDAIHNGSENLPPEFAQTFKSYLEKHAQADAINKDVNGFNFKVLKDSGLLDLYGNDVNRANNAYSNYLNVLNQGGVSTKNKVPVAGPGVSYTTPNVGAVKAFEKYKPSELKAFKKAQELHKNYALEKSTVRQTPSVKFFYTKDSMKDYYQSTLTSAFVRNGYTGSVDEFRDEKARRDALTDDTKLGGTTFVPSEYYRKQDKNGKSGEYVKVDIYKGNGIVKSGVEIKVSGDGTYRDNYSFLNSMSPDLYQMYNESSDPYEKSLQVGNRTPNELLISKNNGYFPISYNKGSDGLIRAFVTTKTLNGKVIQQPLGLAGATTVQTMRSVVQQLIDNLDIKTPLQLHNYLSYGNIQPK